MTTQRRRTTGSGARTGSRPGPRRAAFRPDIEGLRAVAVLLVVLAHAGVPMLAGGYIGVDVFFVISGFLITGLLARELRDTGRISMTRFYARRVTRLLPCATLVLAATLIAAWKWLPITRIAGIAQDALASGLYYINYRLAITGTDYLNADAPPSPMQHFWSLAVEEQFYLVWPLLLLAAGLCWRWRRGRTVPVVVVLALIAAGSLFLSVRYSAQDASWSYFGIHTRAWELAAGALVAVFATGLARLPRRVGIPITWCGLAMILAAAVVFDDSTVYPGYAAVLPVAGTAAVIAGGCANRADGAGRVLAQRPFRFVGQVSYSFYLWHWPVLLIAPIALNRAATLPFNLAAVAAAFVITCLTYYLVENPIRRLRTWRVRPWRGIGLGASLTATTACLAVIGLWVVPLSTYQGRPTADTADRMSSADSELASLRDMISASIGDTSIPANLTPSLEQVAEDRPIIYPDECILGVTDRRTHNPRCEYGDTTSDTTVVLFGDSHAAQWFPALNEIAKQRGWKLVALTRAGCAVASVDIVHELLHRRYTECDGWRRSVYQRVAELKPELVVTTSINGQTPVGADDKPLPHQDSVMAKGWKHTFSQLRHRGTKIAYIVDTPNFGRPVPDCVATHLKDIAACAVNPDRAKLQPQRTKLILRIAEHTGITAIDPTQWFCVDKTCPVVIGNTLIIRDSNHVTTTYTKILAPLLANQLPKIT